MREPVRPQVIDALIAALERWDDAGRTRLKRNAGRSLHEVRGGHQIFFPLIGTE